MTIQDTALFKSYIEGNTLREIFIRGYRKSATFSKNPSSIEEYLQEIEPENVIKKAITNYTTNSNYGYDFWQNANENWLVFLHQGRKRHSYTDYHKLMELDGMFRVLRENWDAAKAWLYEPVEKTLIRLGLKEEEIEQEEVDESKTPEDDLPDINDFSGVPEYDDGLEFFDLNVGTRAKTTRLKSNQLSLNFRSNSFKIIFNQQTTKKIKDNQYKFVRLAKNKQGDIVIQLHKVDIPGIIPVNITFNTSSKDTTVNACINSKDLCGKLKKLLNLNGDYFVLHIEELYADFDKANYKITK